MKTTHYIWSNYETPQLENHIAPFKTKIAALRSAQRDGVGKEIYLFKVIVEKINEAHKLKWVKQ